MTTRTLTALSDIIADALQSPDEFGLPPAAARTLAEAIVCTAARRGHGGTDYYLPMAQHLSRRERDAQIRSQFLGNNLRDICRKFGISKTTVYRIIRRNESPE